MRISTPSLRATRRRTLLTLACGLALLPTLARPAAAQVPPAPVLINTEARAAIDRGLKYLAQTQGRDGSWRSGTNYGIYPVTMTSLAGLALMSGGSTPVEGPYAKNVRNAVDFVLASAQDTGLIARPAEASRSMYGHGFGMLFLAEAYGMEQDQTRQKRIREVLENAIELTGRSQSEPGGWYYTPSSTSDEGSVTITQMQGLRAARNAGIKVPKEIIDKAVKYIEKSKNSDGGIRYRAGRGGGTRPPITAAAVAVLYNAGEYDNPVAVSALQYLDKQLKDNRNRLFGGHKFYTMLYLSQAKYLSVGAKDAQGNIVQTDDDWTSYFKSVRDDLIRTQNQDGSWRGDSVGMTYGTAIGLLTLQLPYKRLPILQR